MYETKYQHFGAQFVTNLRNAPLANAPLGFQSFKGVVRQRKHSKDNRNISPQNSAPIQLAKNLHRAQSGKVLAGVLARKGVLAGVLAKALFLHFPQVKVPLPAPLPALRPGPSLLSTPLPQGAPKGRQQKGENFRRFSLIFGSLCKSRVEDLRRKPQETAGFSQIFAENCNRFSQKPVSPHLLSPFWRAPIASTPAGTCPNLARFRF